MIRIPNIAKRIKTETRAHADNQNHVKRVKYFSGHDDKQEFQK